MKQKKGTKASSQGQEQKPGVDLLDFEQTDEQTLGPGYRIPIAAKRAIIIEKAEGTPTKMIAIRYDCSEGTVDRIWKEFVAQTQSARTLGNQSDAQFKSSVMVLAKNAIQNGLECDRDPYRQANVGIQVMKGIGEFKSGEGEGSRVNILINTVPQDWKSRYIGIGPMTEVKAEGSGKESNGRND